jgi:signal transduction histidine kinase
MAVNVIPLKADARAGWVRRMMQRILGVPLVAKLLGANVLIVASALVVQTIAFDGRGAEIVSVLVALAAALVVNLILVRLALRPIEELEQLAHRVSEGEFDARGVPSLFADKDLAKLRDTVNNLLDSLAAERKRIHDLGAHVVRAQDVERAKISRDLHDSIAQTLAAVRFQLAAAARDDEPASIRNRVAAANGMISAAMEEIMSVSNSLHSRVAEDLGLDAALGTLGRQVEDRFGIPVQIDVSPRAALISPADSAMLFRVAEAALRELEVQSGAKSASVRVDARDGLARLEVTYDAVGLPGAGLGSGLASVKDRFLLAGGKMSIENQNGGTRVTAELRTMKAAS